MANDNVYRDGDIVWVKWNNHWWPGEVTGIERQPEGLIKQLKRKPYCVVKFFNEDTYEYIHNPKKVLPYQCLKKDEFIKKGYSLLSNKNKYMEKFKADIEIAEQLICHKNHVTINNRPDSIVKVILGQPLVRDTNSKLSFHSSKDVHCNASAKDSIMQILDLTPKYDFHEVNFSKKSINTNSHVTATINSESVIKGVKEGNFYQCNFCDFTSFRQNVMILHRKMHNDNNVVKISAAKTSKTFNTVPKLIGVTSQLNDNNHKNVNKDSQPRNQCTNHTAKDVDSENHEITYTEKYIINKRENGKDNENVEEAHTSRLQLPISRESLSITLSTSLELSQSVAACRLPKKKELASLALRELDKEVVNAEGNIHLDSDINSKMITDSSVTNVMAKVLSPAAIPKHNVEEIRKILLADWSDEEDTTGEDELTSKTHSQNVYKIAIPKHFPHSSLPSTSITSLKATVDTKTSGRIRNIPKKDRRDIVLQDFNSDLTESKANTTNLIKQTNAASIELPAANVDNCSNVSDSSLVEIVEDENYSSVIVIPDDENYANDENTEKKQRSSENITDKIITTSEIHESAVKKSNLIKSFTASCFDFREEDMIEKNVKSDTSITQTVLTDGELTKEVEKLLEQTVISVSNMKNTISSNGKHKLSGALLRFEGNDVHVKDLPIKERSKRIFKSRNLTNAEELNVMFATALPKEKVLTKHSNDDIFKDRNRFDCNNTVMIIDKKQNISQPHKAKFEILENMPVKNLGNNVTANTDQANEINSNTLPNNNYKSENEYIPVQTQRACVSDNQATNLCHMISEMHDPLIIETPTDENSSLAASDTGAEFGSPASMLDEERMSTFEYNNELPKSLDAAEYKLKKIHKSNENIHNKVDSHAQSIDDSFVKHSPGMVSTMGNKTVICKSTFLKDIVYDKQKQGESSTSHIKRRFTLEKMECLHMSLLPTKKKLKTKSVSLASLKECKNIEQLLFNFYFRSPFFKRESKCSSDTVIQSVEDLHKKQNVLDISAINLITVSSNNTQINSENQEIKSKTTELLSNNAKTNALWTEHQQMEEILIENCNDKNVPEEKKTHGLEENEKANKVGKCRSGSKSNERLTISLQVDDMAERNNKIRENESEQPVKLMTKNTTIEFEQVIPSSTNIKENVESAYTISKEANSDEQNSLVKPSVNEANVCVTVNLNNCNIRKRKISTDKTTTGCVDFECTTNNDILKISKTVKKRKQTCNVDSEISNIKTAFVIEKRNNNHPIKEFLKFKENEAKINEISVVQEDEVPANSTSRSTVCVNNIGETTKNKETVKLITNTALPMSLCQRINDLDGLESVKSVDSEIPVVSSSGIEEMVQRTDSPSKTLRSDPLVTDQELLDIKILQTDNTTQLDEEFLIEFDSIVNHNCKQIIKEIPSQCNMKKTHEILEQKHLFPLYLEDVLNAETNVNLNILPNNCKDEKMGKKRRKTISGDVFSNHEIIDKSTLRSHRKRKISTDDNSKSLFRDCAKSVYRAMSTSTILESCPSKKLNWNPNQSTKSCELPSTNNITTSFASSSGEIFHLPAAILELNNEEIVPDLPQTVDTSIKINTSDSRENQSQPNAIKILGQQIIPSPYVLTNNSIKQSKQNLLDKEHKPSAKPIGGISSTISNKNKQIGTDSRGNKYVIIKTPAHNLKVHPASNKTPPTLKAKISKVNNLTSAANNILIFPHDDCINVLSPQKDKNTLIDNSAFQQPKRTPLVSKPKNKCNKEVLSALHKNLSCEAMSPNKSLPTSGDSTHYQLNSDKSSFSVASEVSFKAQQQLLQLQQQHAAPQSSINTVNENPIIQSQRKSRKFSQNKVSTKPFTFEQKESQHQQVIYDEIPQSYFGDFSKNNSVNQDAVQIEEPIEQTSKILAVPTQPIPGYNETFLLCTLVDNIYKPIDNVPLYLNHDLNQLVPVPLEILTDEPRLIVNQPVSQNEHLSHQKKSEVFNLHHVNHSNEIEDGCNENTAVVDESSLMVLPPNFVEETIIDENSSELQPISEGSLTILDSNEANQTLVPSNAIILNIEGQQVILDATTFAHLVANPDANTQLVTDNGTEFILTREVLAALQIQHDVQPVAHEQLQQMEENSQNVLTVDLEEPNFYGADVLEINTSENLQLISNDGNISFPPTVSLTQSHLTPPIQANVSETNALLDQTPIMSTSESPSNATIFRKTKVTPLLASDGLLTTSEEIDSFCDNLRPNLEDSLAAIGVTTQSSTVPSSLDLPITVTNPNIAPKVNLAPPIDMVQFAPPRSASAIATAVALAGDGRLFNDIAS